MSGSVLPVSPAPEAQGTSAQKSSSVNREAPDRSQYDTVSRQEQQRLERRETARAEARARQDQRIEDRRAEQPQVEKTARPVDPGQAASAQSAPPDDTAGQEEAPAEGASSAQDGLPDTDVADAALLAGTEAPLPEARAADATVFTFADLQALVSESDGQPLMPAQSTGPNLPGLPGQPGQVQSSAALMAGLFDGMQGGKSNSLPGQGKSSAESTLKLMESLVGQLSAETGKTTDPASSITSRFQGTLELAGQSLTAAAGQKPLEAAIPLRSYTTSVELPVGHAEWGDKLMGKLAWLTSQNMSMAEIHLTPPDMGPMEVRVQVQNEQAAVVVHTTNSAVRDQLELHSHRLRDMLGAQGLGLESFDVADSSARSGQDQADDQSGDASGGGVVNALSDDETGGTQGVLDLSWKGELDIYA